MPATQTQIVTFTPHTPSFTELEQRKLARLRELQATIASLRDQPAADPLLAWVVAQERRQRS